MKEIYSSLQFMYDTSKLKLQYSLLMSPLLLFFEPYNALVKAIGILVILDVLTGGVVAKKEGKDLTSRRFLSKFIHVTLFLVGLSAAGAASPLLQVFGIEQYMAGKWICAFYGIYELFSILENLGKLGLPIAKQFGDLLKSKLPNQSKEEQK